MNGPLAGGKPRKQGAIRLHAVREPRQQARPGFLLRIFHSRQRGAPMDVSLGQASGSQRGQDAEFLDGPYAGAVLPRIGSVRTVAQRKIGFSFQQGKQVTLARVTTAAIPGGHQRQIQWIGGKLLIGEVPGGRPPPRIGRFFRRDVRPDDVQQHGLEAEPPGRMGKKTAVQPP